VISGRYSDLAMPLLYRDGQWVTTTQDLIKTAEQA